MNVCVCTQWIKKPYIQSKPYSQHFGKLLGISPVRFFWSFIKIRVVEKIVCQPGVWVIFNYLILLRLIHQGGSDWLYDFWIHWLQTDRHTFTFIYAKSIYVNSINCTIENGIPGEETTYKSINSVVDQNEVINYPIEFLNSLGLPGMPPHILCLKIGSPIILLRNINPPRLCNGTWLSVKKLMKNIIEATLLTRNHQGEYEGG